MIKFKIAIPVYNCENWIEKCLHSIAIQQYNKFECVVINDASTDDTKKVLDGLEFIKNDDRFTVIHNKKNVKALQNIVTAYKIMNVQNDPESVLVVVDGDDCLYSYMSLQIVASYYEQTNCLLTYGNHIHWPTGGSSNCEQFPSDIIENNKFRDYKFVSSHLRTFKSKLWCAIKDSDLRDEDGNYYSVGCDVVIMMPMLEMARERHCFIPYVIHLYNRYNPISDDVIHQSDQHRVEMRVRNLPRYERYDKIKAFED
tara:strand:+ start:384 stop:1151 length:768 start_codon:yes stop_codon:yes gene_type:complete